MLIMLITILIVLVNTYKAVKNDKLIKFGFWLIEVRC